MKIKKINLEMDLLQEFRFISVRKIEDLIEIQWQHKLTGVHIDICNIWPSNKFCLITNNDDSYIVEFSKLEMDKIRKICYNT